MSIRLILAAASAISMAGPVLAQDASVTPPTEAAPVPAAPAPTPTPEEAAIEARAQAFQGRIQAMVGEMRSAIAAAAGDQAKLATDLGAIEAKYQPEADAFAAEVVTFINARAAQTADEATKAQMIADATRIETEIKGAPAEIRAQAAAAVAQAAATPATPAAAPAATPTPAAPQ